jgi:fructoselysine-6-P-deglycase FrlB-like protein
MNLPPSSTEIVHSTSSADQQHAVTRTADDFDHAVAVRVVNDKISGIANTILYTNGMMAVSQRIRPYTGNSNDIQDAPTARNTARISLS